MSQDTKMGRGGTGRSVGIWGSLPMAGALTAATNGRSPSFPLLALPRARQPAGDGIRMQLPWK